MQVRAHEAFSGFNGCLHHLYEASNGNAMQGYLYKSKPSNRGWNRRWFVADVESNSLVYYEDEECELWKGRVEIKLDCVVCANEDEIEGARTKLAAEKRGRRASVLGKWSSAKTKFMFGIITKERVEILCC